MAKRKMSANLKPKVDEKRRPVPKPKQVERQPIPARLINYFRDVRVEMSKILWPTRQDVVSSTIVVLVTVLFFIIFVGLLDFVFGEILRYFTFGL